METGYLNHRAYVAAGRSEERRFLAHWWQFYQGDRHWVPPYYPALRKALRSPHLRRFNPQLLRLEALPRAEKHPQMPGPGHTLLHGIWERTVATAALLDNPRQQGTLLTLFRCVNDHWTLLRLLEQAVDQRETRGLLGPVALSPYLGAGVLASHWSDRPPLDTPYAPPYLAELMDGAMGLQAQSRLYHLPVMGAVAPDAAGRAQLDPLDPARLASDLLPLFSELAGEGGPFTPPGAVEAAFLLAWWGSVVAVSGWLATMDGEPAGFVLLQPDAGRQLQRANGGRQLWQRWRLRLGEERTSRGRLVAGGVLRDWRRQGLGQQLLTAAYRHALAAGWESLVVGPVWDGTPGSGFLLAAGAEARQRYQLFRWQARSQSWW